MKKINFVTIVFSIFSLVSCKNDEQQAPQETAMPYPVIEVPVRTVTGYTSYPISLEGTVNSGVRAKVPGYITHVLVDEGQIVNKGQVLFRL